MVVPCGEGIWVCVGDSVRVVWYACRVCTCTYSIVCASLYVYVVCVLYVSIVPCVVYVSCGGLFYCSSLFYLRVWVEYCPSNAQ